MKKILATFAVLGVITTPAFAQSFDPDSGTGNVLPFSAQPTAHANDKTALRQSALRAFAAVPGASSIGIPNPTAATGGGSLGYNEMLRKY
jgi:hypothetical protein